MTLLPDQAGQFSNSCCIKELPDKTLVNKRKYLFLIGFIKLFMSFVNWFLIFPINTCCVRRQFTLF